MARPIKKGLDYFPLDVVFFSDIAIKGLKGKYGADGITVYLYILCAAYGGCGYYIKADDDFEDAIVDDLNMSYEKIGQIINFLCRRSLLDGTLFTSDKVLTSHGIQERYQEAVKARGAKNVIDVERKYWVLDERETAPYIKVTQIQGYSEKNGSYSEKNPSYSEKNNTKERKVKKSKVKESKEEASPAAAVCFSEYEKYIGLVTPSVAEGIDYYISSGMSAELINRLIQYSCEQNKRSWQYINAVILGNLTEGILTVDDYNRHRAARTEKKRGSTLKRSKFNNYTDSNKPDYSNFSQKILEEMLSDDES